MPRPLLVSGRAHLFHALHLIAPEAIIIYFRISRDFEGLQSQAGRGPQSRGPALHLRSPLESSAMGVGLVTAYRWGDSA